MPHQAEDPAAALLAAVAARDDAAFVTLYRRYLPVVLRWCLRETGNRELAADLSSEVFAAALISARRYRAEQGSVLAWLARDAAKQAGGGPPGTRGGGLSPPPPRPRARFADRRRS